MSLVRNKAMWMVRVAAVAIGAMAATPAMAQTSQEQIAYYGGSPNKAVLSIPVTASVGGQCGFYTAPDADLPVGEIDRVAINETVNFVPECTAPWHIAVSSQNGGLLTSGPADAANGYLNKAPYTVALNVNNEGGSPVTASCQVANLQTTGGACSFKGTASQTDGLLVPRSYRLAPSNIQLTAPAYAGPGILISGNYADTLTVTVAPAT